MKGISAQDLKHLENVACRPGSAFSTCFRFSRPSVRPQLLATQAMLSETSDIPSRVKDPGIARIKIAWWRNELSENLADSQHPIARTLMSSGVHARMNQGMLDRYFDGLLELTSGQAIESTEELLRIAKETGGVAALLLSGVGKESLDTDAIETVGMAGSLCSLLNDMGRVHCNETWWLPMDLRARFGVSGVPSKQEQDLSEVVYLLSGIVMPRLVKGTRQMKASEEDAIERDGIHFIRILSRIYARRLGKLLSKPESYREKPEGPGEVMAAWWQAIRA